MRVLAHINTWLLIGCTSTRPWFQMKLSHFHACSITLFHRTVQALTGGDSKLSVESVILPDGEDFKTLDDVARVWDKVCVLCVCVLEVRCARVKKMHKPAAQSYKN